MSKKPLIKKTKKKTATSRPIKNAKAKSTRFILAANPQRINKALKKGKHWVVLKWFAGAAFFALLVLSVVPASRYFVPALVIHKSASIVVVDAVSGTRISEANVSIGNSSVKTDQVGAAEVTNLAPGKVTITVSKPFYKDYSAVQKMTLFKRNPQITIKLTGLGNPAKLTVKNKLSGRLLSNILVKTTSGATARTNQNGVADIMLPSGTTTDKATLTGESILPTMVQIQSVIDDHTNVFTAVPTGKVYYLSMEATTVDVTKSNLDGSQKQVVIAGTGNEDKNTTVLLAAQNWKHLALKSSREGADKLYIVDTANDSFSAIDQDATFETAGWSNDWFVYKSVQTGAPNWQPKRTLLKAYNATTKQSVILNESKGEGATVLDYAAMDITDVFLVDDKVLYTEHWTASYYYGKRLGDKKMTVTTVNPDGTNKTVLHDWQAGYDARIAARLNGANEVYIHVELDGVEHSYWRYYGGIIQQQDQLADVFLNGGYQEYLDSPNGQNTLWSQKNDGKNTLFIGDRLGNKSKPVAALSDYTPYGWFTNDYILVSKNGRELYVFGRDGVRPGIVAIKVGGYHTPSYAVHGYGQGYQK